MNIRELYATPLSRLKLPTNHSLIFRLVEVENIEKERRVVLVILIVVEHIVIVVHVDVVFGDAQWTAPRSEAKQAMATNVSEVAEIKKGGVWGTLVPQVVEMEKKKKRKKGNRNERRCRAKLYSSLFISFVSPSFFLLFFVEAAKSKNK